MTDVETTKKPRMMVTCKIYYVAPEDQFKLEVRLNKYALKQIATVCVTDEPMVDDIIFGNEFTRYKIKNLTTRAVSKNSSTALLALRLIARNEETVTITNTERYLLVQLAEAYRTTFSTINDCIVDMRTTTIVRVSSSRPVPTTQEVIA